MSTEGVNSYIDGMEVEPEDGIYQPEDNAKLSLEIRDFGRANRSLVVRWWHDGIPQATSIVPYEKFTDLFDEMRARTLSEDWDTSLSMLMRGG